MVSDRRTFVRYQIPPTDCLLVPCQGKACVLTDISLTGGFALVDDPPPEGSAVMLRLTSGPLKGYRVPAMVCRTQEGESCGIGLRFVDPHPRLLRLITPPVIDSPVTPS